MAVDDSNVIDKLVKLGLNPREARLYFALLRIPEATPAELDRLSNVPRTKIYEVLGHMATKGLCSERREGGKKYYRATRPSEVKAQLRASWDSEGAKWEHERANKEAELREKWEVEREKKEAELREKLEAEREAKEQAQQNRYRTVQEVFTGLDDLFQASMESDPALEQIEVIRSRDQINLKFGKLMSETKNETLGFTRSPYAASDDSTRKEQLKVQHEILARGVKIRSIYMDEREEHHWMESFMLELADSGEEVRMIDDLPMKMFVFDNEAAMLSLPSVPGLTGADFTMLIIKDPGFIKASRVLFDTYWAKSKTVEEWFKK